jgi:hypothetical protein
MSSKFRGSAPLEFTRADEEGKEQPAKFILTYDANALVDIEDKTGLALGGLLEVLSDPKSMGMKVIRTFVWAGLQAEHLGLSERDAGDIISDAGLDLVMEAMMKAVGGALPKGNRKAPKAKAT